MTSGRQSRFLVCLVFLASPALAGCSMFHEQLQPQLDSQVKPGDGTAPSQPEEKYSVELHPADGKPSVIDKPMSGQLHVQDALEQTGGHKKFKRFYLELMRPTPNGGWHEMTLAYDRPTKRVAPEFDYAVLPGDRIVITEDPSNLIDDVMGSVLKPMGMGAPQGRRAKAAARYDIRE